MKPQIEAFKSHVREISAKPEFLHHQWFTKWHLEVVERLSLELCDYYPEADRELVEVMVWLHDYGKIIDFDNEYMMTQIAGRERLMELGFPAEFTAKAITMIDTLDKKLVIDLRQAPIEVQIVSSADGCSHMAGPFYKIFWDNAIDKTFSSRTLDARSQGDLAKIEKDWTRKIVLPEARAAFQKYYEVMLVQCGQFPEKFFGVKV